MSVHSPTDGHRSQMDTSLFHKFVGLERYENLDYPIICFIEVVVLCNISVTLLLRECLEMCGRTLGCHNDWSQVSLAFTGPGPRVLNVLQHMGQFCIKRDYSF